MEVVGSGFLNKIFSGVQGLGFKVFRSKVTYGLLGCGLHFLGYQIGIY